MTKFLKFCTPGDKICSSENCITRENCYVLEGFVRSSVPGKAYMLTNDNNSIEISVISSICQLKVPMPDSLVTAKVTRVSPRLAKCLILLVDGFPLNSPFHGLIKREDVRAKEKDSVDMYKCFRPCDIIMAKVICYGDSSEYLLSTAENELGVIHAVDQIGEILIPISWTEFQSPTTGQKEFRKVAKIQPEFYS